MFKYDQKIITELYCLLMICNYYQSRLINKKKTKL